MTSGHDPEALAAALNEALARLDESIEEQARKLASERVDAARALRARDASQALAGTEEEWIAYNTAIAGRILAQMEELGDLWRRRLLRDDADPEDAVRIATPPSPVWTATIASLLAGLARQRVEGKMDHVRVRIR